MKILRIIALLLCLMLMLSCVTVLTSCEGNGGSSGNGKSSCKNCGRSPVYDLGFCKSCYKSFMNYTYGK